MQGGERWGWRLTACAVEETVTRLDGVVDLVGASVIVYFPETKTDCRVDNLANALTFQQDRSSQLARGHLVAAAELGGRSSHG